MANRKEKHNGLRLLSSVSAFLLIGVVIYIVLAGFDMYSTALLTTAILGLGVPSVITGDGFLEVISGFFEAFFDGVMEVVGGILDFFGSLFG